ncbi:MAG TPA: hydrolase [Gammaproteobacteria bacterium]|nr:hydrolase [Gammaproteobacteria bacterium]
MLIAAEESMLLVVDVQEKLVPLIHDRETMLAGCRWLLGVAGEVGIPTLATEQYRKGLGSTVDTLAEFFPADRVHDKTVFSCLGAPESRPAIEALGRRQVVVCGIEAHVCVLETSIELNAAGYDVFVVADAVGSRSPTDRHFALERMRALGIHVVTREMVAFEWMRRAGTDLFRRISRDYLR